MAKKKVNIEIPRSGAAAEVPSGDVNIVYNDVRIAGLSETVDATLKTGGTVVQHDIEVEYTKPETNYTRTLTINGNDNFDWSLRIPNIFTSVDGEKTAIWKANDTNITVLTGDASVISCIVESVAEPEGSKTHPDNITGDCVISYSKNKVGRHPAGLLILNPNATTFEITIVANNK